MLAAVYPVFTGFSFALYATFLRRKIEEDIKGRNFHAAFRMVLFQLPLWEGVQFLTKFGQIPYLINFLTPNVIYPFYGAITLIAILLHPKLLGKWTDKSWVKTWVRPTLEYLHKTLPRIAVYANYAMLTILVVGLGHGWIGLGVASLAACYKLFERYKDHPKIGGKVQFVFQILPRINSMLIPWLMRFRWVGRIRSVLDFSALAMKPFLPTQAKLIQMLYSENKLHSQQERLIAQPITAVERLERFNERLATATVAMPFDHMTPTDKPTTDPLTQEEMRQFWQERIRVIGFLETHAEAFIADDLSYCIENVLKAKILEKDNERRRKFLEKHSLIIPEEAEEGAGDSTWGRFCKDFYIAVIKGSFEEFVEQNDSTKIFFKVSAQFSGSPEESRLKVFIPRMTKFMQAVRAKGDEVFFNKITTWCSEAFTFCDTGIIGRFEDYMTETVLLLGIRADAIAPEYNGDMNKKLILEELKHFRTAIFNEKYSSFAKTLQDNRFLKYLLFVFDPFDYHTKQKVMEELGFLNLFSSVLHKADSNILGVRKILIAMIAPYILRGINTEYHLSGYITQLKENRFGDSPTDTEAELAEQFIAWLSKKGLPALVKESCVAEHITNAGIKNKFQFDNPLCVKWIALWWQDLGITEVWVDKMPAVTPLHTTQIHSPRVIGTPSHSSNGLQPTTPRGSPCTLQS